MSRKTNLLIRIFTAVLLVFALLLAAWVPLRTRLDARLEDTALSLQTSRGRERRQTLEYNQVSTDLPAARARLEELKPQAEAAAREVGELKARRRTLRNQKKELEAGQDE